MSAPKTAGEIAEGLSERERELVVMANLGKRPNDCATATEPDLPALRSLAERGLAVEGINIVTGVFGGSFYPTPLGLDVARVLYRQEPEMPNDEA